MSIETHVLLSLSLLTAPAAAAPKLNQALPAVTLDGDDGGRLDGVKWQNTELNGKVSLMFYVDPDVASLNDETAEAVRKERFSNEHFNSVAIINSGATWIPNGLINSNLKEKQRTYPRTTYVRDLKKVLVKAWEVDDDSNVILLFDPNGKIIFYKSGKLSADETKALVDLIRKNLPQANP